MSRSYKYDPEDEGKGPRPADKRAARRRKQEQDDGFDSSEQHGDC
jgi:hypothetical protein